MGGDGGCVNTRVDMVKTRGYGLMRGGNCGGLGITPSVICRIEEDRMGKLESRKMQMQTCRISQHMLRAPIIVDRLGNLMNKEALMEGLLSKSLGATFEHIRSLKDVKEVNIVFANDRPTCPLTKRELDDGGCRSVALWNCGCVIEQKNMQTASKKTTNKCPQCAAEVGDVIMLAPDDEEIKDLRARLPQRKKKRTLEKGEEKPAKEKKEDKTTKILRVSHNMAQVFKVGNTRDGFGCPAYVRRN
eukprot:GEMP01066581.1.p1 GENE.GEMP01066581.1~~GEMP01066581.1.p1  ORF type:complete len:245 (+),score=56.81 GEMP01066581.1:76-810(+)